MTEVMAFSKSNDARQWAHCLFLHTLGSQDRKEREILLETEELKKVFKGKTAVEGASLYLDKGESVGLLGPNGAGKSTTDRKSTRLNSSHVKISYAVFC